MCRMHHEHPGRLIRGWLQANNQTQGWLAKEAGISPSIISDVLRRKRKVNPDLALRIEAVTGVVASDLVQAQARYDLEQTRLDHAAALGDQP